MTTRTKCWRFAAAAACAVTLGCSGLGTVNQGQVVEFDRARGLIVLIQDSNYLDSANPRFDVLPPVTVRVPADRREMGPAPEPGGLLALDLEKKQVVIFDPSSQGFRTIDFTLIRRQDNVPGDDPRVAGTRFPLVDREKREVTIYRAKLRQLVTISVPEAFLGLPADSWRAGDEVRYYYKDPGQALRLMNITKTDVSKAGK